MAEFVEKLDKLYLEPFLNKKNNEAIKGYEEVETSWQTKIGQLCDERDDASMKMAEAKQV